jgi:1-acyl-sn-glycerol-3-phosphate acyltransferase
MALIYSICIFLQRITLRSFSTWRVIGISNVPKTGPLIIAANHQSNFDPPLLSASIPRKVNFLAKGSVFTGGIVNYLLKAYGAHPVNRDSIDLKAYRWATQLLKQGNVIVIFPEGTRNPKSMAQPKKGAAKLAIATNAKIIPVGITGTENLGTWLRVLNPTGKLTVNIGPPIDPNNYPKLIQNNDSEALLDIVMKEIAKLVPSEYRGIYS